MDSLQLDTPQENQIGNKIAWLSLDERDNDPTRFLVYLISALRTIEINIAQGALSALQSPQPSPIEDILTSLINEISAIPDRLILVLDDYHLIEAQPIHEALTFVLENQSPHMHLVIATREDPHLPLARLRARAQLTELRAAELRFTSAEAAEFLNQAMGLDLSEEDISELETRTEGWIVGLQLAAISLQGQSATSKLIQSFSGSNRLVLDYLIEEVLAQQLEHVQSFLLQTAILNRLTGPLCNAVTGQENGQETLEMLDRANLFIIPLDNERRWFRYHHLFTDLLHQRLNQTQRDQLPGLHSKASDWYSQEGFRDEAIDHALGGKLYKRAAHLIEMNLGHNYERVTQTTLRRWLSAFPDEFISVEPQLCILRAWTLFTTGQIDAAEQSLQAADEMLDSSTNQDVVTSLKNEQWPDPNRLIGRIAAIRSFMVAYSGGISETIRYACKAIEFLPEDDFQWRSTALVALGDAYANQGQMAAAHQARLESLEASKASGDSNLLMIVNLRLAEILRQQGKLQQVISICERQYKQAVEIGISEWTIVAWLYGIWGEVLAEINELDQAFVQAQRGMELAASSRDLLYSIMSKLCLVRVLFSYGDLNGAEEAIQSMENSARKHDLPSWAINQLSAWNVRIWLAHGKLEAASQWMIERGLDPACELTYQHEMEFIALARILIAQGRLDAADKLLLRLHASAEVGGRTDKVIEILILQALTAQVGGDTEGAMTTLGQALSLAEPEGFVRTFVDEGPPMASLLYEALSRRISPDYVRRLLAAFPIAEPEQADPSQTLATKSELIEPLSERELEVLQLIAQGLTNPRNRCQSLHIAKHSQSSQP